MSLGLQPPEKDDGICLVLIFHVKISSQILMTFLRYASEFHRNVQLFILDCLLHTIITMLFQRVLLYQLPDHFA